MTTDTTIPPFDQMAYNPKAEKLVEIIQTRTSLDPLFIRVIVAYYFAMMASAMRVTINTHDRGPIPVNLYALALSPSGTGKGVTTNFMESEVTRAFQERFVNETFLLCAEQNLPKLANKKAVRAGTDPDDELIKLQKQFDSLGPLLMTFDDASSPAIKAQRFKLQMADAGAMNLQVDEIGLNLPKVLEAMGVLLELFDVGQVKNKLTKNSSDNVRLEELKSPTPMNMLLFGTPTALLNGSKTEEELHKMLDTGYARRCFFGYSSATLKAETKTAEQVFTERTNKANFKFIEDFSEYLENLADMTNMGRTIGISREVSLKLIQYQLDCQAESAKLSQFEEVRKAELVHRYFKALKLAGAYAFIDNSPTITQDHLFQAIKLAEASGKAFNHLLTPEKAHVKLAKYLGEIGREVTQADMVEDLPFYRGQVAAKQDMLNLAIAWGYKNNILIKKSYENGVDLYRGESLKPTDLSKIRVAWSTDVAYNYANETAPFDKLHQLTQRQGLHWINHHLVDGHRCEESATPGFNCLVIDLDGGTKIETAKALLSKYHYLIYTTKRHTDQENRFRVVLPTNFNLELDAKDYKEFMANVFQSLPFDGIDLTTNQRARKWLSHDGQYCYNQAEGLELFDVLPYIPKTTKNEERKALLNDQSALDNLERWMLNNSGDGNRNNMLLRFAMMLVDAGFKFEDIKSRVLTLNAKMPDKLDDSEIYSTILVTAKKNLDRKE